LIIDCFSSSLLKFTVVSEPSEREGEDGECADLGAAVVDLRRVRADLDGSCLPVLDEDGEEVGQLVVSLNAMPFLNAIRDVE